MTDVNVLKEDKNEMDVELSSLTIAEILRVYLNKDSSVKLAAWKREHPTKNPVLHVETSSGTPKSAVKKSISAIQKDVDKATDEFKKLK